MTKESPTTSDKGRRIKHTPTHIYMHIFHAHTRIHKVDKMWNWIQCSEDTRNEPRPEVMTKSFTFLFLWIASIFLLPTHFKHVRQVLCHCVCVFFFLCYFPFFSAHTNMEISLVVCLKCVPNDNNQATQGNPWNISRHFQFDIRLRWKKREKESLCVFVFGTDRRCRLARSTKLLKVYRPKTVEWWLFEICMKSTPKCGQ